MTWREWDHTSLACAAVVDLGGSHHTRPQSRAAELRGAALGALTRQQDETLRAATGDETFTAIHVDVETHTRRRRAKARPRIRPREAAGRRAPHQGENDQPKHTRGPTPTLPKRDSTRWESRSLIRPAMRRRSPALRASFVDPARDWGRQHVGVH